MLDTRDVMNKVYEKNKQIIDKIKHLEQELGIKFTQIEYKNLETGDNDIILENEIDGRFKPLD